MGAKRQITINEYEMTLIRVKARQLAGKYGFTKSDREDIEQDLALHMFEHVDQFDPRRSSQSTFVNLIVNRRIISILRQRFAQRRDCRRTVSLSEVAADQENDRHEPVYPRSTHVDPPSDLAIDLNHAIEHLDGDTQNMCRLLMQESIAETARRLGLTRAGARTRIAKIRKLLTNAGVGIYANVAAKSNADGVSNR